MRRRDAGEGRGIGRHGANHILYPWRAPHPGPDRSIAAGDRRSGKTHEGRPIAQRPSSHAHLAWLLYAAALAYATLYPLSGWRLIGVGPFTFLTDPWPRYWTWFDFLTNVAAYLPLGVFGTVRLRGKLRDTFAAALSIAAGVLLSMLLEAVQTWLPERVPSRVDWLANSIGVTAGAVLVVGWHRLRGRPGPSRVRWSPDAGLTFALLLVWVIVQCRPQQVLFATGHWIEALLSWQAASGEPALDRAIGSTQAWLAGVRIDARFATFAEACAVATNLAGVGLLAMRLVRPGGGRLTAAGIVLTAGLLASLVTDALLLDDAGLLWSLSPGNQGGLVLGLIGLLLLNGVGDTAVLVLAAVLITTAAVLVNLMPENAYFTATVERWDPGALRNLYAVTRATALAWPVAAVVFCVATLHRRRRMRRL